MPEPAQTRTFATFAEFYPFYLGEHTNLVCRRLHFVGCALALVFVVAAIGLGRPWLLLGAPIAGYGFAWIGHYLFEKNRPATFSHPLYSLMGDWAMFAETLIGRRPF
jgi:hypothetical protein